MTPDQILNHGQNMTAGHGSVIIELFFGCQEKSEDHRKYFVAAVNSELIA
jgi:hypothetical protein